MVDAIAREHDIEQDIEDYESTDGWQDPQFAPADIRFVRRLKQYLKNIKDPAYIDPFTGRKPSREAKRAARNAIILFSLEIKRKLGQKFQESLEQLENGVDSQTVNDEFNKFRDEVDKAKTQDISLPSN